MTSPADALPDSAPLTRDLLQQLRQQRAAADRAELAILELALELAHAHPALPGEEPWQPDQAPSWLEDDSGLLDPEEREWIGLPAVRWDAPAALAAANGMSTTAGKAVIRDVLVLAHRAPAFWAQVRKGLVQPWRARRVAQALLGQPADVCRYVDTEVSRRVDDSGAIGPIVLDRLVDEAMLRMHAEQRELEQLEALDARYVTIDPDTINHTGIGQLDAKADWADLGALNDTLTEVSEVLGAMPEHEHDSLDVLRSIALGILADPARALALLQGDIDAKPARHRDLVAHVHLGEGNILGIDPVMTDADQRAHLDQVIRAWAGRPDVRVVIKPIRDWATIADCTDHGEDAYTRYVPTPPMRDRVEHRDPTPTAPAPPDTATATTSSPSTKAGSPAPATSHPSADITTDSKPSPAGATSWSNPASTSGPTPTDSATSAPETAPDPSPDYDARAHRSPHVGFRRLVPSRFRDYRWVLYSHSLALAKMLDSGRRIVVIPPRTKEKVRSLGYRTPSTRRGH